MENKRENIQEGIGKEMQYEASEYITGILDKYELVIRKQFIEGDRCKGVYLVEKVDEKMVLKLEET